MSDDPFPSADAAVIWAMQALVARRDGRRAPEGPCRPDDVLMAIGRLYRARRINLEHARIIRVFGEMGRAPIANHPSEGRMYPRWREAMERLTWPLMRTGIVALREDRAA